MSARVEQSTPMLFYQKQRDDCSLFGASGLPAALSVGEDDGAKCRAAPLTDGDPAPFLHLVMVSLLIIGIWLHS